MTTTQRERWALWLRATAVRVVRFAAGAAAGTIGAQAVFTEVAWDVVAGAAVLGGVVEALMCLASLPEAEPPLNLWGDDPPPPL